MVALAAAMPYDIINVGYDFQIFILFASIIAGRWPTQSKVATTVQLQREPLRGVATLQMCGLAHN